MQNFAELLGTRPIGSMVLTIAAVILAPGVLSAEEHETEYVEPPVTADDRQHWSFQPLEKVTLPAEFESSAHRNEIDTLVAAQLARRSLQLQPPADSRTLIRRVSYDQTGLPPSPEEVSAFVASNEDDAYAQLVERLLASPRYGERWAQHWLDLARFAETDGFEHDKVRTEAWKYRDWVIKALNDDMPYDEFIRQQIAGDELYPGNEAASTATRFCLSGPDMPDINLLEERRHTVLNELTSTVGEVVLGLQVGCAQCHDHKYDPISQADFYRLRSVFAPAVQLKKNQSLTVLQESLPLERASHLMLRGDFRRPGPELEPGIIRVAASSDYHFQPQPGKATLGRRTALAEWLVHPDNPLTARVIANRVWQHHFGRGIVDTPSEFGLMGSAPSNQPLLDWLASYLIDEDWSLKALHRKILLSATYRQRSYLPADASPQERETWQVALKADPNAASLSRYPRWRLEGEAIRDAMLLASGQFNLKAGGPGVRPPLPKELVGTLLRNQWNVTADASEHTRRSIYVFARRNLRYPIFEAFDRPSANASCPDRNESTTAPQSLHLLNSEFSLTTARKLAEAIREHHTDQEAQIEAAFQRTLSRKPTGNELATVGEFWQNQAAESKRPLDPLTHLCLSLFNCNEFVYVD